MKRNHKGTTDRETNHETAKELERESDIPYELRIVHRAILDQAEIALSHPKLHVATQWNHLKNEEARKWAKRNLKKKQQAVEWPEKF